MGKTKEIDVEYKDIRERAALDRLRKELERDGYSVLAYRLRGENKEPALLVCRGNFGPKSLFVSSCRTLLRAAEELENSSPLLLNGEERETIAAARLTCRVVLERSGRRGPTSAGDSAHAEVATALSESEDEKERSRR